MWRRYLEVVRSEERGVSVNIGAAENTRRILSAGRAYRRVTGEWPPADRVPVELPIWVEARDARGSVDRARFAFLFLVPRAPFLDALDAAPKPSSVDPPRLADPGFLYVPQPATFGERLRAMVRELESRLGRTRSEILLLEEHLKKESAGESDAR